MVLEVWVAHVPLTLDGLQRGIAALKEMTGAQSLSFRATRESAVTLGQ
jgi:hypothetical protein